MTTDTVIYIIIAIVLLALIISDRKNYWKDHAKVLLNWKMEIIIVLVLIALSFTATELMEAKKSRFTEFTMGSFTSSDIEELNVIDRSFAGKWDIVAKDLGKYFRNTAIYLIPFSLLLFRGSIKRRLVLFFIFAQGYSMTESLTGIAKGLVERFRPFTYRSAEGVEQLAAVEKEKFLEDIVSPDVVNSFFSGDVSMATFDFAFFAMAYSLIYTNKTTKTLVWILAAAAILVGAYLRAMSGKHFPTDVLAGALVGCFVACAILNWHQNKQLSS